MADYIIFTDSGCDLPAALAEKMALRVQPLSVHIEDRSYKNYLDEHEIRFADFYALLRQAQSVKTSAVNQQDFIESMTPLLEAGHDILYIGFSSGLSGTFAAGMMAAKELQAHYPERKLLWVDTLCASMGQGLMLYLAWQKKQAGATIEEVRDYVEETKLHLCHWFTVDDLMHLKRGGRISATTALIGGMLGIKPIMHMDDAGKLAPVSKVRGRKAALKRLVEEMRARAIEPEQQTVFISHGDCLADAEALADMVRREMGVKEVVISYVGPVIGAHSGPGTLALFFLGRER